MRSDLVPSRPPRSPRLSPRRRCLHIVFSFRSSERPQQTAWCVLRVRRQKFIALSREFKQILHAASAAVCASTSGSGSDVCALGRKPVAQPMALSVARPANKFAAMERTVVDRSAKRISSESPSTAAAGGAIAGRARN